MEIENKYGLKIYLTQDVIDFLNTQNVLHFQDGTEYYRSTCIIKKSPDGTFEYFHDEWDLIINERNK